MRTVVGSLSALRGTVTRRPSTPTTPPAGPIIASARVVGVRLGCFRSGSNASTPITNAPRTSPAMTIQRRICCAWPSVPSGSGVYVEQARWGLVAKRVTRARPRDNHLHKTLEDAGIKLNRVAHRSWGSAQERECNCVSRFRGSRFARSCRSARLTSSRCDRVRRFCSYGPIRRRLARLACACRPRRRRPRRSRRHVRGHPADWPQRVRARCAQARRPPGMAGPAFPA